MRNFVILVLALLVLLPNRLFAQDGHDRDEPPPEPSGPCVLKGTQDAPECAPLARDPQSYALFATEKVEIRNNAVIVGRVYSLANGLSSKDFAVTVGTASRVEGSLIAPRIQLSARASVRDIEADELAGAPGHMATRPYTAPKQLPPIQPRKPGVKDVRLIGDSRLDAGGYGAVEVAPGATLILTGGEYAVRRLTIESGAKVLVWAATQLTATESIKIGDRAQVIPHPLSGHALNLTMISGATDIEAFSVGDNAEVVSILYGPTGTVTIGAAKISGSVTGKIVVVEAGAAITGNSHLSLVESCSYRSCHVDYPNNYVCKKVTVKLDDGDPCTIDSCDLFGIQHEPAPVGSSCMLSLNTCGHFPGTCSASGKCNLLPQASAVTPRRI